MFAWMLYIAVLFLAYVGFALLALGQERHWRAVTGSASQMVLRVSRLRGLGCLALAVSFGLALLGDGPSFGTLLWITLLSLSAMAVAFTLAWRPKWLSPLAICAAWPRAGGAGP